MRHFKLFLCLFFITCSSLLAQEERITNYDVNIQINKDRSIEVTENLEVIANGNSIKRGIVRRLPTYQNGRGVRYENIQVQKDGQLEPFHLQSEGNSLSVYIGEESTFIDPGTYTYTIHYRVPNQVRFFDDFDEIYWNAVGTEWDFPIDSANCTVQLLDSMMVLQTACYTGYFGEQNQECNSIKDSIQQQVIFELTQSLEVGQGFTIALGFQKGLIEAPTFRQRYIAVIVLAVGCLSLLIYFLITTFRYGIDPPKPAVYAIYDSPEGYSSASVGYLLKEKYDPDLLTASLISLAVKGYIYLEQSEERILLINRTVYTIRRLKTHLIGLPPEEYTLMSNLFDHQDEIKIDGKYNSNLKHAIEKFKKSLKNQHKTIVKQGRNKKLVNIAIVGTILFALLSFILIINSNGRYGAQAQGEVFLLFFLLVLGTMLYFFFSNFKMLFKGLFRSILAMVVMMFIASIFSGELVFFLDLFRLLKDGIISLKEPLLRIMTFEFLQVMWDTLTSTYLNLFAFFSFLLFAVLSISYYRFVIQKPSKPKQKLRSELEGFKMYLEMTEKNRLELLNPPDRTPEHFEKMLPFAYALKVANNWSEQFKEQLEQSVYQPKWSNNQNIYHNTHSFDRSFSRSLASSSTPPSSSGGSGSSGGGSSGGGGGGGGGGGW